MRYPRQKVFISRELRPDSPLYLLNDHLEIIAESLLEFTALPFSSVPETEWVFFYSQQGVKHFFDQWKGNLTAKYAAFGPKTGQILRQRGIKVSFTGDGVAETTALAFRMLCSRQRVLFVRANHSRKSLQQELAGICEMMDLVVYDNQPRKNLSVPECDILIFTSPLNARSYFEIRQPEENQKIIAIGNTTRLALIDLGAREVLTPDEPTEISIVQLLRDQYSI